MRSRGFQRCLEPRVLAIPGFGGVLQEPIFEVDVLDDRRPQQYGVGGQDLSDPLASDQPRNDAEPQTARQLAVKLGLDIIGKALECRGDQIRLWANMDNGSHARAEDVNDLVPELLRVIDPLMEQIAAVGAVVTRLAGDAGEDREWRRIE